MARGFSSKEALLGIAVVLIAGAIIFGIGSSIRRQDGLDGSAERMRRVYVALTMYEESASGMPAPDLSSINLYLPDAANYQSDGDPYLGAAGPFPVDGGLPSGTRSSPFRISFAYLWAHRPQNSGASWDWSVFSKDLNVGFLANEWLGDVKAQGGFKAEVSGPVLRVNRDGSLQRTSRRSGAQTVGDLQDLFGIQEKKK